MTKEQKDNAIELLFKIYEAGVQNETIDLTGCLNDITKALSLHNVSQQRELFVKEQGKWLMANTNLSVEQIIDFEMEFINK